MDTIESIKTEIRHQKWREMYEAYLSSGQTVTEWCTENCMTLKRKIRCDAIGQIEQHDIVPFKAPPSPATMTNSTIRISGSGIEIELPADISQEIVTAAIRWLRPLLKVSRVNLRQVGLDIKTAPKLLPRRCNY